MKEARTAEGGPVGQSRSKEEEEEDTVEGGPVTAAATETQRRAEPLENRQI